MEASGIGGLPAGGDLAQRRRRRDDPCERGLGWWAVSNRYVLWSALSGDGHLAVFTADIYGGSGVTRYIFTHDRVTGTTTQRATGDEPAISADGRYVAFLSADPLV